MGARVRSPLAGLSVLPSRKSSTTAPMAAAPATPKQMLAPRALALELSSRSAPSAGSWVDWYPS